MNSHVNEEVEVVLFSLLLYMNTIILITDTMESNSGNLIIKTTVTVLPRVFFNFYFGILNIFCHQSIRDSLYALPMSMNHGNYSPSEGAYARPPIKAIK